MSAALIQTKLGRVDEVLGTTFMRREPTNSRLTLKREWGHRLASLEKGGWGGRRTKRKQRIRQNKWHIKRRAEGPPLMGSPMHWRLVDEIMI